MKPEKMSISAECQFGFHNRCREQESCNCKDCNGHKKQESIIEVAARKYSNFARQRNLRPQNLNLSKVTHVVMYRAANEAKKHPEIQSLEAALRAEGQHLEDKWMKEKAEQENSSAGESNARPVERSFHQGTPPA